jgi:hypothetical protein
MSLNLVIRLPTLLEHSVQVLRVLPKVTNRVLGCRDGGACLLGSAPARSIARHPVVA